jgi:predicted O-linked N-acetylglucosamine transferase (SPINDLY family)
VSSATASLPVTGTIRADYERWVDRGRAHQKAGRLVDAMICYRRALNSNTYAVEARYELGEVLRDLGLHDQAQVAWRAGLALQPRHVPLLLSLADAARRAGAHTEAMEKYREILALEPDHNGARIGVALSRLLQGDESAYAEMGGRLGTAGGRRLDELARVLAGTPHTAARRAFILELIATRGSELPPLLLALALEELVAAGEQHAALATLAAAEAFAAAIDELEVLRRLARVAAALSAPSAWGGRYAERCIATASSGAPMLWPRRSAGSALRVAYLLAPGARIEIDGLAIDAADYLRAIVAAHPVGRVEATVLVVDEGSLRDAATLLPSRVRVLALGASQAASARTLAEIDPDALIDLVGMNAAVGPLLAQRPARSLWTYAGLAGAHVAPLIGLALPPPAAADDAALEAHRVALEEALQGALAAQPWFANSSARSPAELAEAWRAALVAHQAGQADAALAGYRDLLADQPGYAPAQHMLGVILRERGQLDEAVAVFSAALAAAPAYAEPRVALADLYCQRGDARAAIDLCREGLRITRRDVTLWRALGLARLAHQNGRAARKAFKAALDVDPADATTQYNLGVALQMLNRPWPALRSYQRALALNSDLIAADFNIGVIFREQNRIKAACAAFEHVLTRAPRYVAAHKALCETLFAERRMEYAFRAFERFETNCPDALPMAVIALEAKQYRAEFAALDAYLERLKEGTFRSNDDQERADTLEELLYMLLFFDIEPDALVDLYKAYDAVARRIYGAPVELPAARRPGRIRVGYLSGDLRDHVMGKMMWSAVEHHDRERFETFFYSLSRQSDSWTERYRGLADHFEVIAHLTERDAAERIAADEIDILVDLSTNTRGAKPGILALKPARVQITHIASAGVIGLSTIDFKLTDGFADLPEQQRFQLETFLPMDGCVYPYRRVAPAGEHPFTREALEIAPDAVVIGAFVSPLKLSRRCLALWREVLEQVPDALLAISPQTPGLRKTYARLFAGGGIPNSRVRVIPQGRNEAENQARYHVVDFTLDPMPFGGANGTLESLNMEVPVVTLVGARHGERTAYSMLTNLGVPQTIATTGRQYVEIAVRLATDAAFAAQVRAAIRAGLDRSPLTDMPTYTRNLERAYLRALELRFPAALARADG